jgi:hypothetical protein
MKKYCAVIVEPREHKALSFVLNNFLNNLSDEWLIIIMHGNNNNDYIDNIISNDLTEYKNRIVKINLIVSNLTSKQYSELLTSEYFYNNIPSETFLVFQVDTMISEKNKNNIYQFLDYDYVGAPWKPNLWKELLNGGVGNGGLSLRKKQVCLDCIKNNKWIGQNEDEYFSEYIKNKPNIEEAKYFSVETMYCDSTFGVHNTWHHISKCELQLLMLQFNGLDRLMELNNYFDYK